MALGGGFNFNSSASSTYQPWNKDFYVIYADGRYINGTLANDTVDVCLIYSIC